MTEASGTGDVTARERVVRAVVWVFELGMGMARRQTVSHATLMGSGAAFWLVLAIVPMLTATISLAGLIVDPHQVVKELEELIGGVTSESAVMLDSFADSVAANAASLSVGLAVSIGAALWSVGTGTMYLIRAVTLAYEIEETRGYVKLRIKGMLIAGVVVALVILILVVPSVMESILPSLATLTTTLVEALRLVLTFVVLMVAFVTFYAQATPRPVEETRRGRLPGALLASVLCVVGTQVFAIYVANFSSYSTVYGALAGVVIFMVLMWLLVLFVLYGAILNAELRSRSAATATPAAAAPTTLRHPTAKAGSHP